MLIQELLFFQVKLQVVMAGVFGDIAQVELVFLGKVIHGQGYMD